MIISLVRLMAIIFLAIALIFLAFSNATPAFRLVFLGWQTIPIPLGFLGLAAVGGGLLAGLSLRVLLWSYVVSRVRSLAKKEKIVRKLENIDIEEQLEQLKTPADYSQPSQQFEPEDRKPNSPIDKIRNRLDNYSRPRDQASDQSGTDPAVVRDANYRVIQPPQNTPKPEVRPQVESTLKPDNQDWGFDFDDEE
jgi:uncharacterized integral membrane protein